MADIVIQDTSVSTEYVRSEWAIDFVEGGYSPPSAYDVVYYFGTIKTVKDSVSATDESKSGWLVEFLEEGYESPSFQSIEFYFGTIKPVKDFGSGSDDASIAARTVKDFIDYVTYVYVYTEGVIDVEAEVFDSSYPTTSDLTISLLTITVSDECIASDSAFQAFHIKESSSTTESIQSSSVIKIEDSGQTTESLSGIFSVEISDAASGEEVLAKPTIKYINFENDGYFSPDPFEIAFEFIKDKHVVIYDSGVITEDISYETWDKTVGDSGFGDDYLLKFDGLLATIHEEAFGISDFGISVPVVTQDDATGADEADARILVEDFAESSEKAFIPEAALVISDTGTGVDVSNFKIIIDDAASGTEDYQIWYILNFEYTKYTAPDATDVEFNFQILKSVEVRETFTGHDRPIKNVFDASASQHVVSSLEALAAVLDEGTTAEKPDIAAEVYQDDYSAAVYDAVGAIIITVEDSGQGSDERYEEISSTDFDFKESGYTAPSSTSLEFNFHDYDKAIQITVDATAVDIGTISEGFSIEAILPIVSDSLDTTVTSALIAAESTVQDDGTLSDERPVKVVRDTAYAVEWPSQSWFQSDVAYSDEVVARVITDLCEGSDKLGQKVEVSDSCIASELFTVQSTVFDSDASTTASKILVEAYTLVSDSSDTAQDAVSKFRTVFDSASGQDSYTIDKRIVVSDQSQSLEILSRVLQDTINYSTVLARVIKDRAYGSGLLDRYPVVTDSSQADERIVEVIPETIHYDEVIARIVQDFAESTDYPGKGFLVRDEAFADDKVIKVVQEYIHYDEGLIRVLPLHYQLQDDVIKSVLVRDVGRVKKTNEKLVRIISDQSAADDSRDPEVIMHVFDQFTATDIFSIDFSNIIIQDQCSAEDSKQIILTVQDAGSTELDVITIHSNITMAELCFGKFRETIKALPLVTVGDSGNVSATNLSIYITVSEQINVQDIVPVVSLYPIKIKEELSYKEAIKTDSYIYIYDNASGQDDWTLYVHIKVLDGTNIFDEIGNIDRKSFIQDEGTIDEDVEISPFFVQDQSVTNELIARIIQDTATTSEEANWRNNAFVFDLAATNTTLSIETDLSVTDEGKAEFVIRKHVFDQSVASENVVIEAYAPQDDLAATWHWHATYPDDGYIEFGEGTDTVYDCRHARKVAGKLDEDTIHSPIKMSYDESGSFGMEYDYQHPLPLFSWTVEVNEDGDTVTNTSEFSRQYRTHRGGCPYDGALGHHNTEVQCYLVVEDSAFGRDKAYAIVEIFDEGHISDYAFNIYLFHVVSSIIKEAKPEISEGYKYVEAVKTKHSTIAIQDTAFTNDTAIKVVVDYFGEAEGVVEKIFPPDIQMTIKDEAFTDSRLLMMMANLYDGDLVISINPETYGKRLAKLVDFLNHHQYTVLVKDDGRGISTSSKMKFDYKEVDSAGREPSDRGLVIRELIGSYEIVESDWIEGLKIVRDASFGNEILRLPRHGKLVYDEAVNEIEEAFVLNETNINDEGKTNYQISANSLIKVEDQGVIEESMPIQVAVGTITEKVYITDAESAPLWFSNVTDKVSLGLYKKVSDSYSKAYTTIKPPNVVADLQDEIVGFTNTVQGLTPDVVVEDFNSQWGTGNESIKLT